MSLATNLSLSAAVSLGRTLLSASASPRRTAVGGNAGVCRFSYGGAVEAESGSLRKNNVRCPLFVRWDTDRPHKDEVKNKLVPIRFGSPSRRARAAAGEPVPERVCGWAAVEPRGRREPCHFLCGPRLENTRELPHRNSRNNPAPLRPRLRTSSKCQLSSSLLD